MAERKQVDWESVERDYSAGLLSLREIAAKHSVMKAAGDTKKSENRGLDTRFRRKNRTTAEEKKIRTDKDLLRSDRLRSEKKRYFRKRSH